MSTMLVSSRACHAKGWRVKRASECCRRIDVRGRVGGARRGARVGVECRTQWRPHAARRSRRGYYEVYTCSGAPPPRHNTHRAKTAQYALAGAQKGGTEAQEGYRTAGTGQSGGNARASESWGALGWAAGWAAGVVCVCSLHRVSLSLKRFRCRKLDMDALIARGVCQGPRKEKWRCAVKSGLHGTWHGCLRRATHRADRPMSRARVAIFSRRRHGCLLWTRAGL